jgi:CheY-like chemotaxis protein
LIDWLQQETYRVVWVRLGQAAIDLVNQGDVSAVILDLGLPDMDGMLVLATMRMARPSIPVVVVSAQATEQRKRAAMAAGARAFIGKPFDRSELRRQLLLAMPAHTLARKTEQARRALMTADRAESQRLLNEIPGMFWYKDTANGIERVNSLAAASIGLTVPAVEGCSTYDLYPDEANKYYADDQEVIRSGEPKVDILELYPAGEGGKEWVLTGKVPYRNAQGAIVGVLVFAETRPAETRLEPARDADASRRSADRTPRQDTAPWMPSVASPHPFVRHLYLSEGCAYTARA